jgi:hypothetical protein
VRWTAHLGHVVDAGHLTVTRTVHRPLFAVPGWLLNRSGHPTLRTSARWPWATTFTAALNAIRALPPAPADHDTAGVPTPLRQPTEPTPNTPLTAPAPPPTPPSVDPGSVVASTRLDYFSDTHSNGPHPPTGTAVEPAFLSPVTRSTAVAILLPLATYVFLGLERIRLDALATAESNVLGIQVRKVCRAASLW